MIDLLDGATQDEKEDAKADVHTLMQDVPRTKVAATRLSMLLTKVGAQAGSALRELIVDIASEAAKKLLFPGGA